LSQFAEYELDPGHLYLIPSLDGECPQQLRFVKRVGENFPGNTSAYPGTTSQAVLRCLIRRTQYVDKQIPDPRNEEAIQCLRRVIYLFEQRAAERHGYAFGGREDMAEVYPLSENGHASALWEAESVSDTQIAIGTMEVSV
jgi:hypothetical protein